MAFFDLTSSYSTPKKENPMNYWNKPTLALAGAALLIGSLWLCIANAQNTETGVVTANGESIYSDYSIIQGTYDWDNKDWVDDFNKLMDKQLESGWTPVCLLYTSDAADE